MDDPPCLGPYEAELADEGTLQMLVTLLYADRLEAPDVHAELRRLLSGPDQPDQPERSAEG